MTIITGITIRKTGTKRKQVLKQKLRCEVDIHCLFIQRYLVLFSVDMISFLEFKLEFYGAELIILT